MSFCKSTEAMLECYYNGGSVVKLLAAFEKESHVLVPLHSSNKWARLSGKKQEKSLRNADCMASKFYANSRENEVSTTFFISTLSYSTAC